MYTQGNPKLWTGRLDSETDPKQFRHFQTDMPWIKVLKTIKVESDQGRVQIS